MDFSWGVCVRYVSAEDNDLRCGIRGALRYMDQSQIHPSANCISDGIEYISTLIYRLNCSYRILIIITRQCTTGTVDTTAIKRSYYN